MIPSLDWVVEAVVLGLRSPDEVLGFEVTSAGFGRVGGTDTTEGLCSVTFTVVVTVLPSLDIGFRLPSLDWSLITSEEEAEETKTAGGLEAMGWIFSTGVGTVIFTGAVLGCLRAGWLLSGTGADFLAITGLVGLWEIIVLEATTSEAIILLDLALLSTLFFSDLLKTASAATGSVTFWATISLFIGSDLL